MPVPVACQLALKMPKVGAKTKAEGGLRWPPPPICTGEDLTMAGSTSNTLSYDKYGRHPLTAAVLSVVPGLGQLYTGEMRKGFLYLDVSAANFVILFAILFTDSIIKFLNKFGSQFHFRMDDGVLASLSRLHLGSPASLLILAMMIAFAFLAARDAYDRAALPKHKPIYPENIIDLSEATSGSYLAHFAIIFSLAIVAIFFVAPKPLITETVEITLSPDMVTLKKPIVPTISTKATEAHGRHDPTHEIKKTAPANPELAKAQPAKEAPAKAKEEPKPPTAAHTAEIVPQPLKPPAAEHANPAPPKPLLAQVTPPPMPVPQPKQITAAAANAPKLPAALQQLVKTASLPALTQAQSAASNPSPVLGAPKPLAAKSAPAAVPLLQPGATPTLIASAMPAAPSLKSSQLAAGAPAPKTISSAAAIGGAPFPSLQSSKSITQGQPSVSLGPSGVTGGSNTIHNDSGPQPVPAGTLARTTGTNGTSTPAPSRFKGDKHGDPGNNLALAPALPSADGSSHARPDGERTGVPAKPGEGMNPTKTVDAKPASEDAVKNVDFTKYMAELQRRIKRHWFPPQGTMTRRVVALFQISRDGTLSNLRITHSSGLSISDNAAMTAVQTSAPFDHLPDGAPENVDIEFTFDYNVFNH
jgi:TonB family protein